MSQAISAARLCSHWPVCVEAGWSGLAAGRRFGGGFAIDGVRMGGGVAAREVEVFECFHRGDGDVGGGESGCHGGFSRIADRLTRIEYRETGN
jgi:hypothetical protein